MRRLPTIVSIVLACVLARAAPVEAQSDDLTTLQSSVSQLHAQGKYSDAIPIAERYVSAARKLHGEEHAEYATALSWFGLIYQALGRYEDAEPLYQRSLSIYEKALGPDHPNVGAVLSNLAELYRAQGRYADAEPLYKRSLGIREKAQGPDHPDVATSLNGLAVMYYTQGRTAEAEPLYKRGLAIREKALGPDHPLVATSLINLGALYQAQGRYADAEPLYKRSLGIYEKALGPDHPDVATSLNNLAGLYQDQGRYADAEPLYKRSLGIREKAQGPDHPDVATSLNNLAELYRTQGRTADAEPLFKRSLGIREKAQGPDHADVGNALSNLAALYDTQGRTANAEPLYKRGLAIQEKALGPDHPSVGATLNNLAGLYEAQGRYGDAETLYKRALAIHEKALGPEHRGVAMDLNNLAELYRTQGRFGDAEPLAKRSLEVWEKALGPDHPDVGIALNNLARLYHYQGRYGDAEPLLKRTIALLEKGLGPEHPHVGAALNSLAELYRDQGRYGEAEALYKRSIGVYEKARGPDDPSVGAGLNNLAALYHAQGRYGDAEPLYKRSLALREKVRGPDHPAVAESLNGLAALYVSQSRYGDAEPLYKRSLGIYEKALGPDHPNVGRVLNNLAALYQAQGRYGDAEPLHKRTVAVVEKALGPDHPDVGGALNNLAAMYFVQHDWARAANFLRRSTRVIIRRAQRGVDTTGPALTGKGKSEAERESSRFRGLVTAIYRLGSSGRGMFETAQWAQASEAAASLAQMAARGATGDLKLASIVRERQDLLAEWQNRDAARSAAVSQPPDKRNKQAEAANVARLGAIDTRTVEIDKQLAKDFPDYAALVSSKPSSIADVQSKLRDGEALVLFLDTLGAEPRPETKPTPEETFIWVVTKTDSRWVRSELGRKALQERVATLRCGLDRAGEWKWPDKNGRWMARKPVCASLRPDGLARTEALPFDLAAAHALYKSLFGEVEDLIKDKHLLLVPSGALTSLPFQVLVTAAPAGDDLASAAWLIRDHALTVLPSVPSLEALRRPHKADTDKPNAVDTRDPFIGFGDPVLLDDFRCGKITIPTKCPEEEIVVATAAPTELSRSSGEPEATESFFRNGRADVAAVKTRLCPLPDTAHELKCVAQSLGAAETSVVLGKDMTETAVKSMLLDRYRIVHFATHGLLAGETVQFAKNHAEPALAFSPPDTATEEDDGLLTASEVAGLKLDADWVVMSACNTASGAEPGAEPFSGLAKAFFYAGARALLVSHWPVNSYAATMLTSRTFAEMKKDSAIGRSEAFRRAMLALMSDKDRPWAANPSVWAPFVVVGEGGAQASH